MVNRMKKVGTPVSQECEGSAIGQTIEEHSECDKRNVGRAFELEVRNLNWKKVHPTPQHQVRDNRIIPSELHPHYQLNDNSIYPIHLSIEVVVLCNLAVQQNTA
jgi:hypothetical protein